MSTHWIDEALSGCHGAVAATLISETCPEMVKKHRETKLPNPYFGRVMRRAARQGMLGANYENAVNRQRERECEGDSVEHFSAESLWKGMGAHDTRYTVQHKGTLERYLVLFPKRDEVGMPIALQDQWLLDGKEIQKSLVKDYLKESGNHDKQQVERVISWRLFKLCNIVELHVNGKIYTPNQTL